MAQPRLITPSLPAMDAEPRRSKGAQGIHPIHRNSSPHSRPVADVNLLLHPV